MSRIAMKNRDIVSLVNMGVLNVDYSVVDGKDAYKVYRTLRDIRKAAQDIEEQRGELIRRHVSDEEVRKAQAYEAAVKDKKEPERTGEEYAAVVAKLNEAGKEIESLMNDTTEIDVRTIPFGEYFKVKKANKDLLKPAADFILEGVLWKDEDDTEVEGNGGGSEQR